MEANGGILVSSAVISGIAEVARNREECGRAVAEWIGWVLEKRFSGLLGQAQDIHFKGFVSFWRVMAVLGVVENAWQLFPAAFRFFTG